MRLRGIEFAPVWVASGALGFFGEGYWFHKLFRQFGLNFDGATFVARTMTLKERQGNLSRQAIFPDCIRIYPRKGLALNAVGLSNDGAVKLLRTGNWQKRCKPFFLSFMAVESDTEERLRELRAFCKLLKFDLPFCAPVGLMLNYSCCNVGVTYSGEFVQEVLWGLDIAESLNMPLVVKISATLPVKSALQISRHEALSAISVTNAIKWGDLWGEDGIDWKGIFGTAVSPLERYGGGALSGRPLLPVVKKWIRAARQAGLTLPLNIGGGILSVVDFFRIADDTSTFDIRSDSVSLGSISFLRPWRVQSIIRAAYAKYEASVI